MKEVDFMQEPTVRGQTQRFGLSFKKVVFLLFEMKIEIVKYMT